MKVYIFLTFGLLGWAYWEMSGGSDFVAESWPVPETRIAAATPAAEPEPAPQVSEVPTVTRAATLPLIAPAPAAPAAPASPAAPQSAGSTVAAGTLTEAPGDWSTAADAVAQQIALETAAAVQRADATPGSIAGGAVAVNGSRVNLRAGPGTDYGVITTLPRGTEAALIDRSDGWAMIELASGEQGWIADYLLDGL